MQPSFQFMKENEPHKQGREEAKGIAGVCLLKLVVLPQYLNGDLKPTLNGIIEENKIFKQVVRWGETQQVRIYSSFLASLSNFLQNLELHYSAKYLLQ